MRIGTAPWGSLSEFPESLNYEFRFELDLSILIPYLHEWVQILLASENGESQFLFTRACIMAYSSEHTL